MMSPGLIHRGWRLKLAAGAGLAAAAAGYAAEPPALPKGLPAAASRMAAGYLKPGEQPDSARLLPPPPAEGTRALARDRKAEASALKLQGTPRWTQARVDADLFVPDATAVMSCAAGRTIGPGATPLTDKLLRKAAADLGLSSYPAKTLYKRPRPFLGNGQPVCTPEMLGVLKSDGSYPSGHAAIGVGWGLILGDLLPRRRAALNQRGRAFADSRRVCNVHFASDVAAGGVLAGAVVEKLRANAAFQADLAAARAELAALPPAKPACAAERAALRATR